ncbi:hypothetical protein ACLOJK_035677 [Asimina triloba]
MAESEVAKEADEPQANGPGSQEGTAEIAIEKKEEVEKDASGAVGGEAIEEPKEEEKKAEDVTVEEEEVKEVAEREGAEGKKMEDGENGLKEEEKVEKKVEAGKDEKVSKSRKGQKGKAKKKEAVSEVKKEEAKNDESEKKTEEEKEISEMEEEGGDEDVEMKEKKTREEKEISKKEEEGGDEDVEMKENDDKEEEKENEEVEEKAEESDKDKSTKKRRRGRDAGEKDGEKKKKEAGEKKVKESAIPVASSSIDRPVRERKSVERLVAVIEKEAVKEFHVEKVVCRVFFYKFSIAYKLSRRKIDDTVKMLHSILFGRRGKIQASQFKSNISQFSGFVWRENEEKQRAKIKERLEKGVKDKLLDICDLLDIPVSKTAVKKEDLTVKLLEFLECPHVTNSSLLAEKDQASGSKKRKRPVNKGTPKSSGSTPSRQSAEKRRKVESTPKSEKSTAETDDDEEVAEDEEVENGLPDADKDDSPVQSESEKKEESEEENDEEEWMKGKQELKKSSNRGSVGKVKAKKNPSCKIPQKLREIFLEGTQVNRNN